MRLVNKEFEEKVAHDLFQTVVVPFSPEIYGIAEEPTNGSRPSAVMNGTLYRGKLPSCYKIKA